jgi:DNA-binding IclR family transcriptional regulator
MPVDFESHDPETPGVDLSEGTNARQLLTFLLDHEGIGYTPGELARETGVPEGSVGPTLARLERAGLVRHKQPYWAAVEDDRLAAATASVVGLTATADRFDGDYYARTDDWDDDLPDLSDEAEDT